MAVKRILLVLLAAVPLVVFAQPASAAIAPGCSAARPTSIGGAIYAHGGTYNNYTVPVQVSLDLLNAQGQKVDIYGVVSGQPGYQGVGGYSAIDNVNQGMPMPGIPAAQGGERRWGVNGGLGNVCVAANVVQVFIETYPKEGSTTNLAYYGGSMDHGMPVVSGQHNEIAVRVPTRVEFGGMTGYLNGYITQGGQPVDASRIGGLRVWSRDGGAACGVQGFSAGADQLGYSPGQNATYYRFSVLASGQCNALSQRYRFVATIDGVKHERLFTITINQGTRVDLHL